MISQACKNAEAWKSKDIMYIVGFVQSNQLKQLSIVYGMDYCADESCYLRIKNTIKESVESIPSIEFAESRELGHINKVDPLGITYMRVRGMWGIENPWKVFSYVYQRNSNNHFSFMCIINDECCFLIFIYISRYFFVHYSKIINKIYYFSFQIIQNW